MLVGWLLSQPESLLASLLLCVRRRLASQSDMRAATRIAYQCFMASQSDMRAATRIAYLCFMASLCT